MNGTPFKLGTFAKSDGKPFAAIVLGDTAFPLTQAAQASGRAGLGTTDSIQGLLGDWDKNFAALQEIAAFLEKEKPGATSVTNLTALPPIASPGKMFYAAQNFQEHVDEMIRAGMSPKDGP
jgi:2-keto-4-pentenoate hydratase/2-oxohepta-3-ene-1,7-dioic acid hydratase in catechol pathway